jgi:hypothetical protein
MNMQRTITLVAALSVTGLAIGLAISSALARAPAGHAAALLAGLSASVVLAVHVAPSLLRSVPRLVLWAHAGFFTTTAADAGAARLASSPATTAAAAQRADLQAAIDQIKARSEATILRQMSWTTDPARTLALQAELQDAQRRQALQDQILALSAAASAAAATAAADPVSVTLASALGISADAVQLTAGLLLALLLEIIGMLLWREALITKGSSITHAQPVQEHSRRHDQELQHSAAPEAQAAVQQIVQFNVHTAAQTVAQHVQADAPNALLAGMHHAAPLLSDAVADDVSRLRAAVRAGQCIPTVAGIREFMRCSQVKARELRRSLDESAFVS